MVKRAFEYMSGYSKRKVLAAQIESKKNEMAYLSSKMSDAAMALLFNNSRSRTSSNYDDETVSINANTISETDSSSVVDPEAKVEQYYTMKDEVTALEESLKRLTESSEQRITFKDIDGLLKWLGTTMSKKQIEQMVWEVDEMNDGCICYDEFCLTYNRNVNCPQDSKDQPTSFFCLLDFVLFAGQSGANPKGYIMEDDCMDILFARHGGANLEKEMKLLFGEKLKASGGDGTLRFDEYLSTILQQTGRRALVA